MTTKLLCIFDGFGLTEKNPNNVIAEANMPNFRKVLDTYFWTVLNADGETVGQEDGLVGNSEVGHLNIGGLKKVPQLSYQITKSSENSFQIDKALCPDQLFNPSKFLNRNFQTPENTKIVHLIGLFSTGKIHSDLRHWVGAIESSSLAGAEKIVLHLLSDGRDSDRKSLLETWKYFASNFADRLGKHWEKVILGSLGGRFYSMDRDSNFDRTWKGLKAMFSREYLLQNKAKIEEILLKNGVEKTEFESFDFLENDSKIEEKIGFTTQRDYEKETFDEHILPTSFTDQEFLIKPGSNLWFVNFRPDRMKQVNKLIGKINADLKMNLTILSMNTYGLKTELSESSTEKNTGYYPIFTTSPVQNILAERISKMNKTQLHIAETEKYAHVTFFLNGGVEQKFEGEDWILIPSNKVDSHAEKPEMKAGEITDYIVENYSKYDYIIVNYANPDMVGHTGDIEASKKSMEFLDKQLGRLLELVQRMQIKMVIIADHGNMEKVGEYEENGKTLTDTEHNSNPVPCIFLDPVFDKNRFLQDFTSVSSRLNLKANHGLVRSSFRDRRNGGLSTNTESWLTKEQIGEAKIPLWYAGVFLLSL